MAEPSQPGWTRIVTRTGRYEYQFQGRVPAVRKGQYEDASDYQFLVMDEEGWLYRIPVRLTTGAENEVQQTALGAAVTLAELQLRAGLEEYRPRQNAPYAELDVYFAVDRARARKLSSGEG